MEVLKEADTGEYLFLLNNLVKVVPVRLIALK